MNQDQNEHDEFFQGAAFEQAPSSHTKKKKTIAVLAVLLSVFLLFTVISGVLLALRYANRGKNTFEWALNTVQREYYREIDVEAIYQSAAPNDYAGLLKGLQDQLDDYSRYYTKREYKEAQESGAGHNTGIGISYFKYPVGERSISRILYVVENSPAQAIGLKKGMYITGYGATAEQTQTGDYDEFGAFVAEQTGEFFLRFGYEADGSDGVVASLSKKSYQAAYCSYADCETSYSFRGEGGELALTQTFSPIEGLDDKTAYIKIDEFSGNADREFALCLQTMKNRGRENLVIDLRGNGGGYLSLLQSMAAHVLKNANEKYPVIAQAKNKNGKTTLYRAASESDYGRYFTPNSQVYALADEGTASASECFIGALVDYGTLPYDHIYLRKSETGEAKTFGKGIMQSHFSSPFYGTMKLTTATVHWPSGNCIHGVGVTSQDGANAVVGDYVWGKTDEMLVRALKEICPQGGV